MISVAAFAQKFKTSNGTIAFTSNAPLEVIKARSVGLSGAINPATRTFAFKVGIISFQGFNSKLQRDHFNENYMETTKYPEASFSGKIIEDVSLTNAGTYKVRAKGVLKIHGVEQERIISATVVSTGSALTVTSNFDLKLVEHKIQIPKIITQKIAEVIKVSISGTMNKE